MSGARRIAHSLVLAAGLGVVFIATAMLGVLVHLDLPAARRLVVTEVNALLATTLTGTVRVTRVGSLGPGGADGIDATASDGDRTVVRASGLGARLETRRLIVSLLSSGPIEVRLSGVHASLLDASLATSDEGLAIARVFTPRPSSSPSTPGSTPGRPLNFSIDVTRATLTAHDGPRGIAIAGETRGNLALVRGGTSARAVFRGELSRVPVALEASLDGDRVDAVLDVPDVDAATLGSIVRPLSLHGRAKAHVEAHGTFAALACTAHVSLDAARIAVDAEIAHTDTTRVKGTLRLDGVDASALAPGAPPTSLDATVRAEASVMSDGTFQGEAEGKLAGGTADGVSLPATQIAARFTDKTASASVRIDEPGAPTELTLDAVRGPPTTIAFEARTRAPDLGKATRLDGKLRGALDLHAKGTLRTDDLAVDAALDARGRSVSAPGLRVASADVQAHVKGPLSDPSLDATASAHDVLIGDQKVARAALRASGPARRPRVRLVLDEDTMHGEAEAAVAIALPFEVRDATVLVQRGDVRLSGRVGALRVQGSDVKVDDVSLEGLGREALLSVEKKGRTVRVHLDAPGVSLRRAASLAPGGVAFPLSGWVSARADVTLAPAGATGTLDLVGRRVTVGDIHDVTGHVVANLSGRHLTADADVSIPEVVTLRAEAPSIELAGDPTRAESWQRAIGSATMTAEVALARAAKLLPSKPELAGTLTLSATATRASRDAKLEGAIATSTKGLVVASGSFRSTGVDADVEARLSGDDVSVSARAHDAKGELGEADAQAKLTDLRTLPFERVPLHATLTVAEREVDTLPSAFRPEGFQGAASLSATLDGTLVVPDLTVAANAKKVAPKGIKNFSPLEAALTGHYDGEHATTTLDARDARGQALHAEGDVRARAVDLLHRGADSPWRGSARAKLDGIRLETVPLFADLRIGGTLRGDVSVDDLHHAARARADLSVDRLRIGRVRGASAHVRATLGDEQAEVVASMDHGDGSVEISARSAMHWGAEVAPRLDEARPAEVSLHARSFSVATLAPFVQATLPEIDGRVDANLAGTLGPVGAVPTLAGTVELRDGTVDVPTFGQQLHSVAARVVITREGVVTLDGASAETLGGRVEAHGRALLHGLSLAHAEAALEVKEGAPVPLVFDGDSLGDVSAHFDLRVDSTPGGTTVDVNVPSLHLRMPDLERSAVQSLTPPAGVRVGVTRADGSLGSIGKKDEEPPPTAATRPVRVTIRLGKDVEIRRGNMLRVRLQGAPTVEATDKVRVSGRIDLVSGTLDVQGKRFIIDNGTVTFVGDDPSNPTLVVTAHWDAGDGTHVFADFKGPLKTGKLTLRSDPALSQSEILALILFGSTSGLEGGSGASSSSTNRATSTGVGLGAAQATQGLNKALGQLTSVDVSTRVDTSSDTPRFDVVWQISRRVSAQIATVIGTPPPGANLDRNFLSIDWSFLAKWSLETTVGDAGSSMVDVLWRHRY